jgi:hypothetical protein
MADVTPRHSLSIPSEFEEPYFDPARSRDLALDAITHSEAENSQLQFTSDGVVGWDANGGGPGIGVLYWADDIYITGFTTPFRARLEGPASIEIQDGEVVYFQMPRVLGEDTDVSLYRSNRIFLSGTRLVDLRLLCARLGDVVYFYNGKSLKDGDLGLLFGGGLISVSIYPPHEHMAALAITPAPGTTLLDMLVTAADGFFRVHIYRNGLLQDDPNDYSVNLNTGIVTLVTPSTVGERFIALRMLQNTTATTTHTHLTPLRITPPPATSLLDMLVTSPVLAQVDLFRNGLIQSEPDDYTLDSVTGFVTLVIPTVAGEIFRALREVNI